MLIEIARILTYEGMELHSVVVHAGESYGARGEAEPVAFAEQERDAVVVAMAQLQAAGLACQAVRIGSTPTAHFARDLRVVTEVRAGV